jgi:hypothetical protein
MLHWSNRNLDSLVWALTIHSTRPPGRASYHQTTRAGGGLIQVLGTTMNIPRVSKWLFLTFGLYAATCAPAILLAEHFGFPESSLHVSQFLAVIGCIPSSAVFLLSTSGHSPSPVRWVAAIALALSILWIGFITHFVLTADFGGD